MPLGACGALTNELSVLPNYELFTATHQPSALQFFSVENRNFALATARRCGWPLGDFTSAGRKEPAMNGWFAFNALPRWGVMWLLAIAIYAALKIASWLGRRRDRAAPAWKHAL